MRGSNPRTPLRLTAAAVSLVLLAGCANGGDAEPGASEPGDDPTDEPTDELFEDDLAIEDPATPGAQPPLSEELDDLITDGTFRGEGVVISTPSGWRFEPAAFAQGLVLAVDADGSQQMAAQAVDAALLPEPLTFEEVVEANRDGFPTMASADEDVTIAGAAQAQLLRFDALPDPEGVGPDSTLLVVIADDGDGRLAVFNYLAPSDEYDDAVAELLLASAGFDPDSDPTPALLGTG